MRILATRIGGSRHAGMNLTCEMHKGHLPETLDGHKLFPASINLVLQVGYCFATPDEGQATMQYVSHGETYFLQKIRLCLYDPKSQKEGEWLPGLIWRNRPHPPEFDNIIEVIAPEIPQLRHGTKQWFKLEGPFTKPDGSNS